MLIILLIHFFKNNRKKTSLVTLVHFIFFELFSAEKSPNFFTFQKYDSWVEYRIMIRSSWTQLVSGSDHGEIYISDIRYFSIILFRMKLTKSFACVFMSTKSDVYQLNETIRAKLQAIVYKEYVSLSVPCDMFEKSLVDHINPLVKYAISISFLWNCHEHFIFFRVISIFMALNWWQTIKRVNYS